MRITIDGKPLSQCTVEERIAALEKLKSVYDKSTKICVHDFGPTNLAGYSLCKKGCGLTRVQWLDGLNHFQFSPLRE